MKFAVVIEKGQRSFGAHVPDLPGCVAVAKTQKEILRLIKEAIEFHLRGLRLDGMPVPAPTTQVNYVEAAKLRKFFVVPLKARGRRG